MLSPQTTHRPVLLLAALLVALLLALEACDTGFPKTGQATPSANSNQLVIFDLGIPSDALSTPIKRGGKGVSSLFFKKGK